MGSQPTSLTADRPPTSCCCCLPYVSVAVKLEHTRHSQHKGSPIQHTTQPYIQQPTSAVQLVPAAPHCSFHTAQRVDRLL